VWLLWGAFLVALTLGVVGGAEVALRVRREWVAAGLSSRPQDDDRFVSDRLLGYVNRPGYMYASQGQTGTILHYTNNALGLRGPDGSRTKPPGVRRIVVVGGSTVYGALVDDSDTITVQLEALLRERLGATVEVINGGVPGYVALQELLFSKSELLALEPDVLIDLDGLNDVFYGSLQEWPAQIAADELGIIGDGRFPQMVAMVDSTMFPNGLLEHQLMMFGRDVRRSLSIVTTRHPPLEPRQVNQRAIALHAQSLGLLARYGRQAGLRMIAALQPLVATGHKQLALEEQQAVQREDYWSETGWQEIALAMYPRLAATTREAVEAEGGSFVDMTDVFDHEPLATYAEDAVHYNPLGDRRLAQALASLIEERLQHQE
jgi:lysophospholipase L1-like esterase